MAWGRRHLNCSSSLPFSDAEVNFFHHDVQEGRPAFQVSASTVSVPVSPSTALILRGQWLGGAVTPFRLTDTRAPGVHSL